MFRCQKCDTVVPAGIRSHKIVLQTRTREYESRGPDPSERRRFSRGRGPRTKKQKYDRGGHGTEIVREIMVCPKCAQEHAEQEAAAAAAASDAAMLETPTVATEA